MNSDRFNPMVIKELRQGLKSRSFLASFLGLQVAMVISMFVYLVSANSKGADLSAADGLFWFMLGLILLLFMPLRSFQALSEEIKGNTLEMLFLTRMNAWKITFGKWCALVIQLLLMVTAILPYFVLRYFLGSIDIAGNLEMLFYMIIAAMLFTSVGVGLSGLNSKLLRGLIIVGVLLSFNILPLLFLGASAGFGGGPTFGMMGWPELVIGLIVVGILMMFFVEYGASQIAPPAENHSLRKRMLALSLAVVLGSFACIVDDSIAGIILSLVLLIPVSIDALCEPLIGIPSVYLKLKKFRIARWLFYPGWVSGFLFVSLVYWILFSMMYLIEGDADIWTIGLIIYNILLFPFVCIRLVPFLGRKALVSYFSLQVISFVFCLLMVFIEEIHFISDYIILGHLLPMLGLFVMADESVSDLHPFLLLVPTGIMLVITLLKARRPLKQMQYLSRGGEG